MKLDFDGIEIAERVCDIELTIGGTVQILRHGLGNCLDAILPLCRRNLGRGYNGCGCRNAGAVRRGKQRGWCGCGGFRNTLWGWLGVSGILERTVCSGVHKGQRGLFLLRLSMA